MELGGYFWQSDFILHVGSLCFTVCVLVQGAKDAVTGDCPEEGEKGRFWPRMKRGGGGGASRVGAEAL